MFVSVLTILSNGVLCGSTVINRSSLCLEPQTLCTWADYPEQCCPVRLIRHQIFLSGLSNVVLCESTVIKLLKCGDYPALAGKRDNRCDQNSNTGGNDPVIGKNL